MSQQASKGKPMSIVRMIVSLGLITAVAAVCLAVVYNLTKGPIAEAAQATQVTAIEAVCPQFNNNPVADSVSVTPAGESVPVTVFPARVDGRLVGGAVLTYTDQGFSGHFTLIVGFDIEGNVVDYRILSHAETPGLGAKMTDWFRDSVAHRSIIGLNPESTRFYVVKDPQGEIDGITAATITSRAFLEAVRRASAAFLQYRNTQTDIQP